MIRLHRGLYSNSCSIAFAASTTNTLFLTLDLGCLKNKTTALTAGLDLEALVLGEVLVHNKSHGAAIVFCTLLQ